MGSFQFTCRHCQTLLNAKPQHAGKTLNCPSCQQPLQVPAAIPMEQNSGAATPTSSGPLKPPSAGPPATGASSAPGSVPAPTTPMASSAEPLANASASTQPATQVCPFCHAQIPSQASKCRFCGEFVKQNRARPKASAPMRWIDFLIAVVLPPVGLGLGIVWMGQRLSKAKWMLLISGPLTALAVVGIIAATVYAPGTTWSAVATPESAGDLPFSDDDFPEDDFPEDDFNQDEMPEEDSPLPESEADRGSNGSSGTIGAAPPSRQNGQQPRAQARGPSGDEPALMRPPEEAVLNEQPEPIQRAMRANVRLRVGSSIGSGVIVDLANDEALILTNRHVVDPVFSRSRGRLGMDLESLPQTEVMFVSGGKQIGKVVWISPQKVDLALVLAACRDDKVRQADCDEFPAITHGESAFAVGNPIGLGWSLTRGTVSATRQHNIGTREIPVIQTDTAINPGNSGGGLYNAQGQLIGISDFIVSQALAQSVGFAIRYSIVEELYRQKFSSLSELRERYPELTQSSLDELLENSRIVAQLGNLSGSLLHLEKALAAEPDNQECLLMAAQVNTSLAFEQAQSDRLSANGAFREAARLMRQFATLKRELDESEQVMLATFLYNEACCDALEGKSSAAITTLKEAIEAGYVDVKNMENDPDLESLRDNLDFQDVIARLRDDENS